MSRHVIVYIIYDTEIAECEHCCEIWERSLSWKINMNFKNTRSIFCCLTSLFGSINWPINRPILENNKKEYQVSMLFVRIHFFLSQVVSIEAFCIHEKRSSVVNCIETFTFALKLKHIKHIVVYIYLCVYLYKFADHLLIFFIFYESKN